MRKKMRRHLVILMLVSIVGLLPLLHLRNTTEARIAMAASYEFDQVIKLDEQSYWNMPEDNNSSNDETSTFSENIRPSEGQIVIETAKVVSVEQDDSVETSDDNLPFDISEDMAAVGGEFQYWALAILASGEVGSATQEVQLAVISAILNRVNCPGFPNNVYDVVTEKEQFMDGGHPKFTDENGEYRLIEKDDVPDSIKESIHIVLTQGDFSNGAVFFISPHLLPEEIVNRFHSLYGEPCLIVDGGKGEFFTKDYGEPYSIITLGSEKTIT